MKMDTWHPSLDDKCLSWLQIENHEEARALLPAIWQEAVQLCRPMTWVDHMEREEFFSEFAPHAGKSTTIVRLLAEVDEVWLLVATIGEELEKRTRSLLMQREIFHSYILDRLGSYLVEDLITHLDNSIAAHCRQRQRTTTRRYSPGYRDFSLAVQQRFVELAGNTIPCLQLSSNFILKPVKSVTAVKGCGGK